MESSAGIAEVTIIAIVLARMDSTRLPGKAIMPLNGGPLLEHVLRRARRIPGIADVVLATSERPLDDPLVAYAEGSNLTTFRGPVLDVALRCLQCARAHGAHYFIRANADSPFLDPQLIGRGVEACEAGGVDFATNLIGRTFPYGVSVEILRTSVYELVYPSMPTARDREHVTAYFYRHLDKFTVHSQVSQRKELSGARLTVDTGADLVRMRRLVERLGPDADTAGFETVAEMYLADKSI